MKRSFMLALSLLFLSSTGMALADTTTTAPATKVHHHKHHKGGKKSTINPQPLPPRVAPGTNPSTGAPGSDKSEINKNQ